MVISVNTKLRSRYFFQVVLKAVQYIEHGEWKKKGFWPK